MRVFIAEKPSLGKAIAAVLPGPQQRHKTYIVSGEANVVVWCAGHIMEQYLPEDYDPALKNWRLDSLPIEPDRWEMKVSKRSKDLYNTIKRFSKDALLIVHAGDPDREGQLLVDEVLEKLGIKAPVKRLLICDLNPAAVKRSLSKLENNTDYAGLRDAALGRGRADWLYGLNLTRLYTVLGREGGHQGLLSVGRVQTPVLGLIVRRDLEIEAFTSKPFYTLKARVEMQDGAFDAHWAPGDAAEDYLDDDNRVVDRQYAANLAQALTAGHGEVISVQARHKKEAPPLPFSLPELQKVAAKGRGLSPKQTLTLAQSLYEKHQVLTYPRSDCPYLPLDHWNEAAEVRDAVSQSIGKTHALALMADEVDLIHRGKCWNDEKITAHHAIIPTKKWVPLDKLTADECWLYEQVAHRYLLQFCVDREYDQTDVRLQIAGGEAKEQFKARGRVETQPGWTVYKAVLSCAPVCSQEDKDDPETQSTTELPALSDGEALACPACELVEKETTPPKRFTEATLLDAMTGIARFVQDPAIKQTLKETDGLGTPATQATIIDTLFRRGYLEKRKKRVYSTTLGREMIKILPEQVTLPDMTARWEQQLAQVENGDLSLDSFMAGVVTYTRQLVGEGKTSGALVLEGALPKTKKTPAPTVHHACPGEGCDGRLRRIKTKKGFFWGCTKYGEGCKETCPDSRGKPASAVKARTSTTTRQRKVCPPAEIGAKCPECQKGSIQLKALKTGKNAGKSFNGCTNYPACRYFVWPDSGSKRETSA